VSTKEFNLKIKLGNDLMQTSGDIAGALRKLADKLDARGIEPSSSVTIMDDNGHTVGVATMDRYGKRNDHSLQAAVRALGSVEARVALVKIATSLGAVDSWNGGDQCETIAGIVAQTTLPAPGEDLDMEFYADIAEDLGWEHDFEREFDDDDPDAEMDRREDQD